MAWGIQVVYLFLEVMGHVNSRQQVEPSQQVTHFPLKNMCGFWIQTGDRHDQSPSAPQTWFPRETGNWENSSLHVPPSLSLFITVGYKLIEKRLLFILESLPTPAQCYAQPWAGGFALRLFLNFIFLVFKPNFALRKVWRLSLRLVHVG